MPVEKPIETEAFVVVGIDFGTTYTGVAYTHSDDPDPKRITVITQWPGAGVETRPKVPTEISYGSVGEQRWGWQLRPGTARFGGFKLLLDPFSGSRAYNDERLLLTLDPGNPAMKSTLREGSSAATIASDFLRLVHTEVMQVLARRFPATLESLKIKFIITTPAMWSPGAQHNTLMAAKFAGFGSRPQDIIEIATEPEAAASYALRDIGLLSTHGTDSISSDVSEWQVGKQVIVCDAGGGTVDLISYAIDQVSPYLVVSETTPPRGGLCGATSLDQRFLHLMRERLGSQAHLLDGIHGGRGSRLMQSFDSAKRNFGTNEFEDDEFLEHGLRAIIANDEAGIDEEYMTISYEDMLSIFDPVVDKVVALMEAQLQDAREKEPAKPVVGVILVGGFGESIYLYKRLQSWAEAHSPPLFLINPTESWAAIAKGAVCYGLESIVRHRVLPCHYGVVLDKVYDGAIHDPTYNYVNEFYGVIFNSDTVVWFAKKGERTDRERRIIVPFGSSPMSRDEVIQVKLRTCRYNEPPRSRRDARALQAPSVTLNVGDLPFSVFRQREVRGRTLYQIDGLTLEMVIGSASFKFELRCNGALIRTREVDPEFVGTH